MDQQDHEVAHPGNSNNTSQGAVFRPISNSPWTTLLSIIPQDEAPDIERASLRWPVPLRRRFVAALYQRKRKRWPFSPYSTEKELEKPIERLKMASVYGLSGRRSSVPTILKLAQVTAPLPNGC
jgi:hypothetical protein